MRNLDGANKALEKKNSYKEEKTKWFQLCAALPKMNDPI
jgi:hypothetical protein